VDRLRLKTAGTYPLSVATIDEDGNALTVTDPAIAITDGAGTAVTAAGSPTATAGAMTYALAVGTLPLDTYTATWTGTVATVAQSWRTAFELCGGYLFELADLRAFDPAFADTAKYPATLVRSARTAAEQRFERAAQIACVPRAKRLTAVGNGTFRLKTGLSALRRVVSLSVDGTALTSDELADLVPREWGAIDCSHHASWERNHWRRHAAIDVWCEHGLDYPDEPVSQAVMLLCRDFLIRSPLSSRATVEQSDVGFFRLSIAGKDRPTGIPEVDEVIAELNGRRPKVG
jgi:hypothetical protein